MEEHAQGDFFVLTVTARIANHTDQTALHFDTHSARALDRSTAVTIRAVSVDSTGVALGVTRLSFA